MVARTQQGYSRLSAISAALSSVSVPVLVITAIGHRARLLDTTTTFAAMALGFVLAGLAVITAIAAFTSIWQDGREGVGRALRGLVVGLLVLSFPIFGAWRLVSEPQLTDITTSLDDPPHFASVLADHEAGDSRRRFIGEAGAALQREAHPDLVPRFYPVGTPRVYEEALTIATRRGWQILASRAPGEQDVTGRIEGVASTLVFGFRQDVVIRIVPEGEGALVDMRSAARRASHDLGTNARRIRVFLAALDAALQGVTGG
ncbi:MAG: DUF1499 domain-containing protein [Alphaproteobacteria bacterium]